MKRRKKNDKKKQKFQYQPMQVVPSQNQSPQVFQQFSQQINPMNDPIYLHQSRCVMCSSGMANRCSRYQKILSEKQNPLFQIFGQTSYSADKLLSEMKKHLNEKDKKIGMKENPSGKIALHILCSHINVNIDLINYYLSMCPKSMLHEDNKKSTPFHELCKNRKNSMKNSKEIYTFVLQKWPNIAISKGSSYSAFEMFMLSMFSSVAGNFTEQSIELLELFFRYVDNKKLSKSVRGLESMLNDCRNIKILQLINKYTPEAFQKVSFKNPFFHLFGMRNKNQLKIFNFLCEEVYQNEKKKIRKLLLQKCERNQCPVFTFFRSAQDEYKHDIIVRKLYTILGSDLFAIFNNNEGSCLHAMCSSWIYGNYKVLDEYLKCANECGGNEMVMKVCTKQTKGTKNTPLHLACANGSLIHGDIRRGLGFAKLYIKYSKDAIGMKNKNKRNCLEILCFYRTSNDNHLLEIMEFMVKNSKDKSIITTLGKNEEQDLRKRGKIYVLKGLKRLGAPFKLNYFFDQRGSYEIKFGDDEEIEAKFGYSTAISLDNFMGKVVTKRFRIDKLFNRMMIGVGKREVPKNIYFGTKKDSYALTSEGKLFINGKEKKKMVFEPMKEGDVITMTLDTKKKTLECLVNGRVLKFKSGKDHKKVLFKKLPVPLHFYIGLFKGMKVSLLQSEWSMASHKNFSEAFKKVILTLLMANNREFCEFAKLPKDVLLFVIFPFLEPF